MVQPLFCYLLAPVDDLSRVRFQYPVDTQKKGGLSRSVGAKHRDLFSLINLYIHTV